jgi:uncharacterized protein
MKLKQFVPAECCAKCDVCCRFLDEETPLAPVFLNKENKLIAYQDRFICPKFDPDTNRCKDYENRPPDCQLYPFVIMYDEDYKDVVLGLDPKCPYIEKAQSTKVINYLFTALKDLDPRYISRFQDDVIVLAKLKGLTSKRALASRRLLIGDRSLFERYAAQTAKTFSSYSFVSNYVWTGLLDYYWIITRESLCLFCRSQGGVFMPLPPLGKKLNKGTVAECFKLMDERNKNKSCSRIEDVREDDLRLFKRWRYKINKKGCEYLYRQADLANLFGDKYKSKRALYNRFIKNYKFQYREFRTEDKKGCLELLKCWQSDRMMVYNNSYYKALMEDSCLSHKKAMDRYEALGLTGRVVVVDGKISAYTFGYPLSKDVFVVLFEVADLKKKGLAQFIFREFCKGLGGFKYINLMDDSGLDNLRKVKLSYHPVRTERTYCVYG